MSAGPAKFGRDVRLRRRRAAGASERQLSQEFGLSRTRVRQILAEVGDPLMGRRDEEELRAERAVLVARIRELDEELAARANDRLLGLRM